MMHGQANKR